MAEIVALVDYGAGNLHSVENALRKVGATVKVTADPDVLRAADRIVLPGVGSFRACAEGLRAEQGVIEAMHERVFVGGAPFLGICVGMQLLAARGLEHGETPGLGWIDGTVRLIEPIDISLAFDDGETLRLDGLYTVSLDALSELPDAAVMGLFRAGHLQPAFALAGSLHHVALMARRRNARLTQIG